MFKINCLRMLMAGKAKDYFDLWEVDRGNTTQAKSNEKLLAEVKDYSRRGNLDSSAKEIYGRMELERRHGRRIRARRWCLCVRFQR